MSSKAFTIWTLLAFLVPMYYSAIWGVHLQTVVLFAVVVSSIPYHLYDSKVFVSEDMLSAWALTLVNTLLLVLGGFTLPYSVGAVLFALSAFYYYTLHYEGFSHGKWHILAAVSSMFALMTYAF
jgi:hypothetical protein